MHEKIERAPFRGDRRESRIDGVGLGHVAMPDHHSINVLRERLEALLERLPLVSESKFGALSMASFCNTPRKRPVIGHTHDQTPFAAQEA